MFGLLKRLIGTAQDRQVRRYRKIVQQVNEWEEKYQSLSEEQLKAKTDEFKQRLAQGESLDDLLPEAYAVVKNACRRMCGTEVHVSGYDQQWDMIPFDVQIIGAIAMHNGTIAEMQTGEGKTLTALMPLYLNALTEEPVHLVTVNDYLANRDCQWVGAVLRWLGLTTGALTGGTPLSERRQIYLSDVVYGTASEFGFDYLRDNSTATRLEEQCQRGYYFAIVDEIDSILIDEARTPLIISGPAPVSRQMYDQLHTGVAALVKRQRDFCGKLATEARKGIQDWAGKAADESLSKKERKAANEQLSECYRKLWLISKGTPRNKVLTRSLEDPDIRAAIDQWDLHYYSDQYKEDRAKALADLYILVDERSSDYELTDKGIAEWQKITGDDSDDFLMLDLADVYLDIDADNSLTDEEKAKKRLEAQEEDSQRKERAHNLRQLLRAHLLMEKDNDYIVQEGKVIIIDENTGRPQPGRRFSDGLHQAIEAKEGCVIQKETQTFATVTLQNYFRMYTKLAGMTGTAGTEANEFKEIYGLEVLEIPTHRPTRRTDSNDEIYMTEREKYNAVLKEVSTVHEQGRPILIGTESVEVSEKLARIFKTNGLPYEMLNAKNHAREAEIISQAGQHSAITISTNMAGRGTDIKLGQGVADLGGLYVIGTTRHQSRRIDRQLRGRCARQGDPGSSKFYVSFEDQLMRLFSSPKLTGMLQRFRPPEGEPISAGILNKSIETAQKRVEQRNYTIRKHTLEYDDVMNKQRQEVYAFRADILSSRDIMKMVEELLHNVCAHGAEEFFVNRHTEGQWDPEGYRRWLGDHFPVSFEEGFFDDDELEQADLANKAAQRLIKGLKERFKQQASRVPPEHCEQVGKTADELVEAAIRDIMLRKVDQQWQEHLLHMDHLRTDVNLRAVGQRDPLMEFKHEAFLMFEKLSRSLNSDIARDLYRFEVVTHEHLDIEELMSRLRTETNRSLVSELEDHNPAQQGMGEESPRSAPETVQPIVAEEKVGRNDPCPCGSGKKYKKCCGAREEAMQE